ncbi:MAG: sugar ABC transporter permease [Acetobacteraceae bacterium]|nr:sugar ABC transporter permease [Acetobacteraceae bacterium]
MARRGQRALVLAVLTAPGLAIFVIFALGPMIAAGGIGFLNWDGISASQWAGGHNWVKTVTDPVTLRALRLTFELMALSWLIQTPISLALGVFIAKHSRYRTFLAVLYFLPLLFSAVAIGIVWSTAILSRAGALNVLLRAVGLGGIATDWVGNPNTAFYAVAAVIAWQFIPFHTLLYQAGRRQIPRTLYEAALVDGASDWSQFRHITLPQLRYTIVTSTTLILIGSLTYFDLIFIMTGGGPGFATRTLSLQMYITAFQDTQIGYGSAIAVVLAVAGLVLAAALVRLSGFGAMQSQAEGL